MDVYVCNVHVCIPPPPRFRTLNCALGLSFDLTSTSASLQARLAGTTAGAWQWPARGGRRLLFALHPDTRFLPLQGEWQGGHTKSSWPWEVLAPPQI